MQELLSCSMASMDRLLAPGPCRHGVLFENPGRFSRVPANQKAESRKNNSYFFRWWEVAKSASPPGRVPLALR